MKKLILTFTLLAILAVYIPSELQAGEVGVSQVQNYIAVMDLQLGKGIDSELKALLTNGLINGLVKINKYKVVDRANRNKILKEQGFQLSEACDDECRVQVGRLLST